MLSSFEVWLKAELVKQTNFITQTYSNLIDTSQTNVILFWYEWEIHQFFPISVLVYCQFISWVAVTGLADWLVIQFQISALFLDFITQRCTVLTSIVCLLLKPINCQCIPMGVEFLCVKNSIMSRCFDGLQRGWKQVLNQIQCTQCLPSHTPWQTEAQVQWTSWGKLHFKVTLLAWGASMET